MNTPGSSRIIIGIIMIVFLVVSIFTIIFLRRRASAGLSEPVSGISHATGQEVSTVPSASGTISSQSATATLPYPAPEKKVLSVRPILKASSTTVESSQVLDVAPIENPTSTAPILRLNIDSDADGVSDQDEIGIYHTDPRKADTDGDTYPDGEEIEKGYNPLGPGKCAQPSCIPSI